MGSLLGWVFDTDESVQAIAHNGSEGATMGRRETHRREGVERNLTCEDVACISNTLTMFDEHIRGVNIMSAAEREIVEEEGEDLEVADDDAALNGHEDDGECGPPEETDMVDEAIEGVMKTLVDAGYSDEDAEEAVYDAISTLVDSGDIEDTPDMDHEEEHKALWVKTAIPLIHTQLKNMGLDFTPGA